MAAAPLPLDDLLALELSCSRADAELLTVDEAARLLEARFATLVERGWDWRSSLLLAAELDRPVADLPVPAPHHPDVRHACH